MLSGSISKINLLSKFCCVFCSINPLVQMFLSFVFRLESLAIADAELLRERSTTLAHANKELEGKLASVTKEKQAADRKISQLSTR